MKHYCYTTEKKHSTDPPKHTAVLTENIYKAHTHNSRLQTIKRKIRQSCTSVLRTGIRVRKKYRFGGVRGGVGKERMARGDG